MTEPANRLCVAVRRDGAICGNPAVVIGRGGTSLCAQCGLAALRQSNERDHRQLGGNAGFSTAVRGPMPVRL